MAAQTTQAALAAISKSLREITQALQAILEKLPPKSQ